jgi:isopentenyl diphosphate isomerase/L-lactate dehydrogenase-like FMN-dependent dehydrogenase
MRNHTGAPPQVEPKKPLDHIPKDIAAVHDYERLAKDFIPHAAYEYIAGGSGDELTLESNRTSFDRLNLYNRVLQDVSQGSTKLSLLGSNFRHPILLAPVAHQKLVHSEGELASAAAANAMNAGFVASTLSSVSLEDIAREAGSNKWFQLYFQESREFTLSLVRRAEAAGYTALVVTVDAPINGLRNRAQRAEFSLPAGVQEVNLLDNPPVTQRTLTENQSIIFQGIMADALRWDDITWLKQQTKLPIVIKGILHPSDAEQVVAIGLDGIIVSNHGGRALDGVPARIDALPEIRRVVGEQFPLLLDSGIRRGSDVFKAIALGANAVLVGRPQMYALAVAGALGVAHMLRLLCEELEMTMALTGCPTLADISVSNLYPVHQKII